MRVAPFALERWFARHEFATPHNLAASDVEGMPLGDLLALADDELRAHWERLTLGYTEPQGAPMLRAEIAALDGLPPDAVTVCSGANEAIFLALHTVLGPDDHAVVVWPAYQSLHEMARATGAAVTPVALHASEGFALDLAALQAAIRPNTRAVVVNFPHNPTGAHVDAAAWASLVARCEADGIVLVSDEVYRFLEHDGAPLPAAAALGERAVSIGVLSKSFALAGLRLGWIATRDAGLRDRIAILKDYTTICAAAPSEVLGTIALRARERVLARSRTIVRDGLAAARRTFADLADVVEWIEPRAGTVAFPRLRRGSADRWTDRLRREAGILVLPGSLFGHGGEHVRVGYGRLGTPDALARLASAARHSLCEPPGAPADAG